MYTHTVTTLTLTTENQSLKYELQLWNTGQAPTGNEAAAIVEQMTMALRDAQAEKSKTEEENFRLRARLAAMRFRGSRRGISAISAGLILILLASACVT